MNRMHDQVFAFVQATTDGGAPRGPIPLEKFNSKLANALIKEEAEEFKAACADQDRIAMIDALTDLLYVTFHAFVAMGVDPTPFFNAVHEANMTKAGGSRRSDGKLLKPSNFAHPDLAAVYAERYKAVTRY